MSYELIAILVVGITLGVGQVAAIVIAVSGLGALVREMDRGFEGKTQLGDAERNEPQLCGDAQRNEPRL